MVTDEETKGPVGTNQTKQPTQTSRVLTPPPKKVTKTNNITFSIAGYTELSPSDVIFSISINSETTHTEKNNRYEIEFIYQPSTLWMEMPDGTAFPVLQTPDYTNGLVPTNNIHKNGHLPSSRFWQTIVNESEYVKENNKTTLKIDEEQIPIHERYLIYLLLTQVLSPHYETPDVFSFIFGCAYQKKNKHHKLL